MLRILPPSHRVKKGEQIVLTVICDDPGTIELTYSGPISGPSSLLIPGQREYQITFAPGQYLAALQQQNQGQDRVAPQTFLIDVNWDDITGATNFLASTTYPITGFRNDILMQSACISGAEGLSLINWSFPFYHVARVNSGLWHRACPSLYASESPGANAAIRSNSGIEYASRIDGRGNRWAFTQDGTTWKRFYLNELGTFLVDGLTYNPSGTMGPIEYLIAAGTFRFFAKYQTILTNSDIENWIRERALPAITPQLEYHGYQENTGKLYDHGAVQLDLEKIDLASISPYLGYARPGYGIRYIDTVPVEAEQTISVTANNPGTATIIGARRRVGVPDRASDSEKYETAQLSFYVQDV